MKKFKKSLSLIMCMFLALIGVVGCGEKEDESKVLRVWSAVPFSTEEYESQLKIDPTSYSNLYTKFVLEKFKEKYPDVRIAYEYKGWAEALNENIVRSAAVSQPDIIGTETYTQNLIDLGYLADVEWEQEILNNFVPFTLESSTRNGKLYATPVQTNLCTFIYNEGLLMAAGCPTKIDLDENSETFGEEVLIVPDTWAEVLYCCQKVQAYMYSSDFLGHTVTDIDRAKYGAYIINNDKGIAAGFRGEMYLNSAGGSIIKEGALQSSVKKDQINLNTSNNINGFDLMGKLYDYAPYGSYTLDEAEASSTLLKGEVAMSCDIACWLAGTAAQGVTLKTSSVPVFTYDAQGNAVLTPYQYSEGNRDGVDNGNTKGQRVNMAVGNISYAITKKSTKKEMAMDLIRICLSDEAQAYLLGLNNRAPTTKTALDYVLDDTKNIALKSSIPVYGEYGYTKMIAARNLIKQSLLDEKSAIKGDIKVTGGVCCFSTNINKCWTYYETFMRKIYKDNADRSAITTALSELDNNIKKAL